ncbi:hypothetical protein BGX38DRAFT_1244985, partial [Terfezia claveryi]
MPSAKEEWARTNSVVGKRQAGSALWKTFRDMALAEMGLPPAIKKEAEKALDKLLQDVLKKSRDTGRAHALSQVYNPMITPSLSGNPCIFLVDLVARTRSGLHLEGAYKWDGCPSHCVAIMQVAFPFRVVDKVRTKSQRANDEEVEAFFDLTNAQPIRADSAPPDDGAYFPDDFLDAAEQYNDPGEDSDTLCQTSGEFPNLDIYDSDDDEWEYIARAAGWVGGLAYDDSYGWNEERNAGVRQRATAARHAEAATTW